MIKFRGQRADNGAWIYGGYHLHNEIMLCLSSEDERKSNQKSLIITDGMSDWNLSVPIHYCEVIPESIGECIGLKDKDGRFIFEDDVLQYTEHEGYLMNSCKMIVCFNPENASFGYKSCVGIFPDLIIPFSQHDELQRDVLDHCVIIGNIYDNPEYNRCEY